ncbi:MAG: efflux RND transporter permease subunit [Propionibacteriaceae bacterium]
MSSYLYALGRAAFRHRWRTLGAWLAALVLFGGLAVAISDSFDEQFTLPGTQSQEALDSLALTFPEVSGTSAQVVVVAPEGESVTDTEIKSGIEGMVDELGELEFVDAAQSPFDEMVSGSVSDDERAAIAQVQISGSAMDVTDADREAVSEIAHQLEEKVPGVTVSAGGEAFNDNIPGVSIVEAIGVVVALIVLLITLGSFRAAGMPLLTALLGVALSMSLILAATGVAVISSTTPMLALMLGLAVGIDYALFILSRHREQLASGLDPEESAARSVATAGSAVVFAGLTVMIALSGLAVAGIPFLATMGFAASLAVLLAVLIALTLLPAMMGFAGEKMRPKPRRTKKSAAARPAESATKKGWPARWVGAATRWPIVTIVVLVTAMGALALPAKDLELALPDNGSANEGTPARTTYDLLSEHFGEGFNGPLIVTATIVTSDDPLGVMEGMADDIEAMDGVASVPMSTPNRSADTGIVQVIPETSPDSPETKDLVNRLRGMAPEFEQEYGVETAVTGFTAIGIDVSDRLGKALLPFGILVVGLSLLLLAMVFRSVAVPIKATVGFLLSVGASFGATALVFEHGWLNGPLNVAQTGPVISFLPIILMGILFGLAMDYQVFLVSRIREDYVHGHTAKEAIKTGFQGSAKVVVAAAVIMFAVFAFFVPEGEGPIKTIAFGLAVGVFVDAFVVRMTLVPAVLALLGDKAWWLPRWLDRILPSFDVEGESLARQLAHRDWPTAGSSPVLHAEGLAAGTPDQPLFARVDLSLGRGQVLLVEGDEAGRTALLFALTGRLRTTEGTAKVAGLLLPDQAGALRRRTSVIDATRTRSLRKDLAKAQAAQSAVVVVNQADRITEHDSRAALASLIEQTADTDSALLIGVEDVDRVSDLITGPAEVFTLRPSALAATPS